MIFCEFLIKVEQLRLLALESHYTKSFPKSAHLMFDKKFCSKLQENTDEDLSVLKLVLTNVRRHALININLYDQQHNHYQKHYVNPDLIYLKSVKLNFNFVNIC